MRALILTTLILTATVAFAQERQAPPPPAEPKAFKLPPKHEVTLDDGARLTTVKYGDVPKTTLLVSVQAGNLNESSEKEVWLADVTGAMLQEGTTSRSAAQVAEEAAKMGGGITVNVTSNETVLGIEVLSEFAPQAVKLLADVLENPAFPADAMERIKADHLRALVIAKGNPSVLAEEKFNATLYPNHPYGRLLPSEETLKGFNVEKVSKFYDANYGAARTRIYVAGKFDEAAVEEATRSSFSGWRKGTPAKPIPAKPKNARMVYLVDRPGAVQSTLKLGLPVVPVTHPDYIKLGVTNALLGGYFSSRITTNIREQKGYTYAPQSELAVRLGEGFWAQNADVTTAVTGASLKEIFSEIDELQAEAPSADELKAVQNYMAGSFVLENSSRGGILNQLRFVDLHGLPDSYLENYVQSVHAVTPADVQKMAQIHLEDQSMTIVVVGDRKQVESQVKPFGKLAK